MSTPLASQVRAAFSLAAFAVAALAPACLHAQEQQIRVTVPFAFEDGNEHLAAGTYTIRLESLRIMQLSGNKTAVRTMTQPEQTALPAKTSKVVFHRYGDRYFLHEVWIEGNNIHVESLKSRSEKRISVAQTNQPATDVELALLQTRP